MRIALTLACVSTAILCVAGGMSVAFGEEPAAPPAVPEPAPSETEPAATFPPPTFPPPRLAPMDGVPLAPEDETPVDETPAGDAADAPATKATPDDDPEAAKADGEDATEDAAEEAVDPDEPVGPPQPFLDWIDEKSGQWIAREVALVRPRARRTWSGSVRLASRYRSNGGDVDNDLYGYLNLDYGAECARGWSFSLNAGLAQDLDGDVNNDGFYVFDSISDTFGSSLVGRVYHAWANYRTDRGLVRELRIGRQYITAGDYFHMDGGRLSTRPLGARNLVATVFGGVPSHLYETSPRGDFMGGLTLESDVTRHATAKLSYAHIQDKNRYYGKETNNLFAAEVRGRVGKRGRGRIEYQHLDSEPRYLTAQASTHFGKGWFVRASYRALLTTQSEQVYDLDSYFAIAQSLEPYWDGHLAVSRNFGSCYSVEAGITARQLFDDGDEGEFNREFGRYYVSGSAYNALIRNLDVTLSAERWDASDDDIWALSAYLDYRPKGCWQFQVGTDYSAYRFDIYSNSERAENYGYYARVIYRPNDRWRFRFSGRVDDDDIDEYVSLRLSATMEF